MAISGGTAFLIQGLVNILTKKAEDELKALENQAKKTKTEIGGIQQAWNFAAPAILGVLSGLLVKVGKDAVEFGVQVSDAMKRFQQETGASIAEAERFAGAIGNLRAVNDESTGEIAAALTEVRRQFGELGADAEQLTQQMLDYADATGGDAATATKTIGQTIRAWGLDAKDAGQLMDILTRASQETGVSADDLAATLGRSSAIFQSMGFSVEEATGILAALGKQGVDSSAAITGMRNTLEAATNPTEKQAAAFGKLGISVDELGRPIGGAKGLFDDLLQKFSEGGLTADEMTAALDILGAKAGGDLVRGMAAAGGSVDDLQQKLLDSQGATQQAADAEGQLLGNRVTALYRQFFEPAVQMAGNFFVDVAGKVLDFLQSAATGVSQFGQFWGSAWAGIGTGFGEIAQGIKDIWNDVIAELQRTMADWLTNFTASIDALPAVVRDRLGDIRGAAADQAANLRNSADARQSGQAGRPAGLDAILTGANRVLGGDGSVDVQAQDVLVDRSKKKGPLTGRGGGGGGTSDEELAQKKASAALEADIKALEHKIALEQISKREAISALDQLISRAKAQKADADDIFKLEKERHSLQKQIAAEADKAQKAADAAAKKADAEADRLFKKQRAEREAEEKKAAAEAERRAKEQAAAAETKRKAELSTELELAKLRGQTHREALLQITEQVRQMREAGVGEQQIAELVAAKKKALLDKEVQEKEQAVSRVQALLRGESLLGKGGSTMGEVMSLQDAFKKPEEDGGPALISAKKAAEKNAKGDLTAGGLGSALDALTGGKGVGSGAVSAAVGAIVGKTFVKPGLTGPTPTGTLARSGSGAAAAENASASLNVNISVTADGNTETQTVGGIGFGPGSVKQKLDELTFTTPLTGI